MLNKFANRVISALLFNNSRDRLSLASSTGLLIGLLPLYGYRLIIIVLLSVLFNLNIAALFIGLAATVICPLLLNCVTWGIEKLGTLSTITFFSYEINFENIFSMSHESVSRLLYIAIMGIFLVYFSYLLFNTIYSQMFTHLNFIKKLSISSSLATVIGLLPISEKSLIPIALIVIIAIILRLNPLAMLAGAIVGTGIFFPFTNMIIFWMQNGFPGSNVITFLSGQQTLEDFIIPLSNRQYEYFFVLIAYIIISFLSFPVFKSVYSHKSNPQTNDDKNYVFKDESGKRWAKFKKIAAVMTAVLFVLAILVNAGLMLNVSFWDSYASDNSTENPDITIGNGIDSTDSSSSDNPRPETVHNNKQTFGFYVNWDERSKTSLKKNIRSIDVLIPCWYQLNNKLSIDSFVDKDVDELARKNNIKIMPLVNNFVNNKWDKEILHNIVSSEKNRRKLIRELLQVVQTNKYDGINIDFENLDYEDRDSFTLFMSELYAAFSRQGLKVTLDLPASDNAYDYEQLSKYADSIMLMLYDEHAPDSKSGPVASRQWFESCLKNCPVPSDKLVVGLGMYGYDWTEGTDTPALSLTYEEAVNLAHSFNASLNWDETSGNPYYKYKNGKEEHSLWLIDSMVIYNQILFSQKMGLNKFALWRLGSEDQSMWNILDNSSSLEEYRLTLSKHPNHYHTAYTRSQEIISDLSLIETGKPVLRFDEEGFITDLDYSNADTANNEENINKHQTKNISLTFDDGPNPEYTPQILDILKYYNIKATFFVVGKNALAYPEIVRRIYDEGHDIGNHTYSHLDISKASDFKTRFELTTTQRIIQSLTGRSTLLFRQPYNVDTVPSSLDQQKVFSRVNRMGYTMVGSLIDPKDWEGHSPEEIAARVNVQLDKGSIVLLHDEGIYIDNTIKALPIIIESLRKKGYSFEPVSTLMDKDRDEVMPIISVNESIYLMSINLVFPLYNGFKAFITFLFMFATIIGIIRALFLILFSSKQKRRHSHLTFPNNFNPSVSVVIAAYNEEKVICSTVRSLLESNYPNFEIIVVNDGSKDSTARVVSETFINNPEVRLINKENGGKSSSVNKGFLEARGEIVIVIDADTLLAREAISLLVRHFEDENVAAVSGNVKVGNKNNLLTIWQHIEYVTGLNLERRAFDELNCIPVVPGAIGAWRKELVASLGYYKEDTLAEDADITLSFLKQGYRIVYEEGARAYTESPEDLVGFLKQRLRWSYGTLQCLWKHRGSLFNTKHGMLGFIALPHMWLYQFIFQAVSPITDILFILGLLGGNPSASIIMYLAFLTMDFFVTFYAFKLENENPRPLVWIFLQRIVYRQLMTYVVYKSLFSALKGVKVGWNKLKRKGNVSSPAQSELQISFKKLSA